MKPMVIVLATFTLAVLPGYADAAGPARSAAVESLTVAQSSGTSARTTPSKRRTATRPASAEQQSATPAWQGADPTRGPGTDYIRQMQRRGECIIDEGYGRYSTCNNE